jgi:hypothetical protein
MDKDRVEVEVALRSSIPAILPLLLSLEPEVVAPTIPELQEETLE